MQGLRDIKTYLQCQAIEASANKNDLAREGFIESQKDIDDALELLKEQEAKPPAIMQDIEGIWSTCSMCGHKLHPILAMKMDTYLPRFCSECGQVVKWK